MPLTAAFSCTLWQRGEMLPLVLSESTKGKGLLEDLGVDEDDSLRLLSTTEELTN
jgi:hypothetical protein